MRISIWTISLRSQYSMKLHEHNAGQICFSIRFMDFLNHVALSIRESYRSQMTRRTRSDVTNFHHRRYDPNFFRDRSLRKSYISSERRSVEIHMCYRRFSVRMWRYNISLNTCWRKRVRFSWKRRNSSSSSKRMTSNFETKRRNSYGTRGTRKVWEVVKYHNSAMKNWEREVLNIHGSTHQRRYDISYTILTMKQTA